jgi:hypothetical protein
MDRRNEINLVMFRNFFIHQLFTPPQIGRWHVVDPLVNVYLPISPYAYSLNNPIIFRDADGNYVVGSDGKAVTCNNEGGQIKWSANATADVRRIGNTLLKTTIGTEQFVKAQDASYGINLKITSILNHKLLGNTVTHFTWDDKTKKGEMKSADITIYEGSLKQQEADFCVSGCNPTTDQGNLYQQVSKEGSTDADIAAVAAHEMEHAADPQNVKQLMENQKLGTKHDTEAKPEEKESKVLQEQINKNKAKKSMCIMLNNKMHLMYMCYLIGALFYWNCSEAQTVKLPSKDLIKYLIDQKEIDDSIVNWEKYRDAIYDRLILSDETKSLTDLVYIYQFNANVTWIPK